MHTMTFDREGLEGLWGEGSRTDSPAELVAYFVAFLIVILIDPIMYPSSATSSFSMVWSSWCLHSL